MRWLALASLLFIATTVRADDWPQWLGPNRDGTTKEIVKPWKGELKVAWKVSVGEGHSSPIVDKGLTFLFEKVPGKDEERLMAWTADKGHPIGFVTKARGPFSSMFGAGPRSTPTFADGRIYTFGVTGRLSSQQIGTTSAGNAQVSPGFSLDTAEEFKPASLKFGVSASPLVEGDLVIVPVGGQGAGIVAFDRKDGHVVWKSLNDPASYASPIAFGEGDRRQIVALTEKGLVSLSPKDGKEFWQYPFHDLISESSTTPVKVGDLLIGSSVTLGSVALKLSETDGKPGVIPLWKKPELSCYFSTPVPVGKYLYMITGALSMKPTITLRCVETTTGKTLWSKPNIGKYHAALLRTGNDKLLMLDDAGYLTLLDANPDSYKELARSKVCGETWAHPALANGHLYLRDNKELICLQFAE
ncbi:MAG: PQQ-binding-like beta-propeller repeat protein [Gemmataceae bacterium]